MAIPLHSRDDGSYVKARRNGAPVERPRGAMKDEAVMVRIHPSPLLHITACQVRSDYTMNLLKWMY